MISRWAFAAIVCLVSTSAGFAQTWPTKALTIIVPSAAGSGVDVPTRLYTDRLTKAIGQPVIVRNIPGAGGAIGAQTAAKSAPDGYTFFVASAGHLIANKYMMKTPGYDPDKDFTPVALLNRAPYILLANPSLPVKTVAELTAYVRANPDKLLLAYEGSSVKAVASYFKSALNYPIDLVAYNSPLAATQDTLGGSTQVTIQGTTIGLGFVRDGRLRALAVISDERLPQMPDVPTMAEIQPGFGAFDAWMAMVAPTGTPADVLKRMSAELHTIGSTPELKAIFGKLGFFEETDRSPQRTMSYIKSQSEQFDKMAKTANFVPE